MVLSRRAEGGRPELLLSENYLNVPFKAMLSPRTSSKTEDAIRDGYRPLDHSKDEIRLVCIEPLQPNEDQSSPIRCHIIHRSLASTHYTPEWGVFIHERQHNIDSNDRLAWRQLVGDQHRRYEWGDYYAFSYTWGSWGSLARQRLILLNGFPHSIGANLEEALRALRSDHIVDLGIYLWIDALCINQRDLEERGREVGRMSTIFSRALDTFVWLGSGNPSALAGLTFVKTIDKCWDDAELMETTLTEYLQTCTPQVWDNLMDVALLPYFERQWVLQEIAAGTENMPITYGAQKTNWKSLWKTFWNFKARREDPVGSACMRAVAKFPAIEARLTLTLQNEYHGIERVSHHQWILRDGKVPNTMDLLTVTRPNLTSDRRDMIYGLLSLFNPELAARIVPDYTLDPLEVYRNFAKSWIEVEESLEVLGQCDYNCNPSWVPRFDVNVPWFKHINTCTESPYNSHGGQCAEAEVSIDGLRLATKAIIVSRIDGLTSSVLSIDFRGENAFQPARAREMYNSKCSECAYQNLDEVKEAMFRSSGGNRDLRGTIPAPANYAHLITTQALEHRRFGDWVTTNKDFKVMGRPWIEYFTDLTDDGDRALTKEEEDGIKDSVERFSRFAWNKRMFTTENGYVGYIQQPARVGDCIAVMPGCPFPVALIKVEDQDPDTYKVRGACYAHGLMDAEAWQQVEAGELLVEDITII